MNNEKEPSMQNPKSKSVTLITPITPITPLCDGADSRSSGRPGANAAADPAGAIRGQSEGQCQGRILFEQQGSQGFGYDPLFEIVEYLKNPLTEKQLETLLAKLNKKPLEIVRTQEEYYKTNLKGKNFKDHEWIRIMVQNPRLISRPIIEKDYKAVIGDLSENIDLLLK